MGSNMCKNELRMDSHTQNTWKNIEVIGNRELKGTKKCVIVVLVGMYPTLYTFCNSVILHQAY